MQDLAEGLEACAVTRVAQTGGAPVVESTAHHDVEELLTGACYGPASGPSSDAPAAEGGPEHQDAPVQEVAVH